MSDLQKEFIKQGDKTPSQEMSSLDSKLFKRSQQAYSQSESFFDHYKDKIDLRYRSYNSEHAADTKYCKTDYKKNSYFVPKTHEFVKTTIAQFMQAYFQNAEYLYYSSEDGDVVSQMSSDYYSYVMNYRLQQKNNWWMTFVQMTSMSEVINNIAIAKVDWLVDDKMPIATPILIENFRIDPQSDPLFPIESTPYIIHRMEMYVDEILEKQDQAVNGWYKLDPEDLQSGLVGQQITNNTVDTARFKEGYNPRQGFTGLAPELQKVWVHENVMRERGKYYVFYTLGTIKLLSKAFKLEEIYPQGNPFVMSPMYAEENKVYSSSLIDQAYPIQRQINDYTNIIMDAAEQAAWPVTMVKANTGFDVKRYQMGGANMVIEVRDPQKDVAQLTKQVQPQLLKQELPFLMQSYDSVMGGSSVSTGNMQNKGTLGSENNQNQASSQVIEMYLRYYNEKFIEPVLKLMLKCEQIYGLTDNKFIDKVFSRKNLLEKYNDKLVAAKITSFEIDEAFTNADLKLTLNVGLGSVNPQMRLERFMASITNIKNIDPSVASTMFDIKAIIKEIMTLNGYKDSSKYINEDVNPKIAELQQQVQDLTQKLMAKKTPEEIAADIELSKANAAHKMQAIEESKQNIKLTTAKQVKVLTEAQFGALQTAQVIVAVPETTDVADQLMENAGYVDPTPQNPLINSFAPTQEGIQNEQNMMQFKGTQPILKIPNGGGVQVAQNPNPLNPAVPANPMKGFNKGIETPGSDIR